ncbi:MOSC domain-containing protein [Acidihalobacter yilgarnensis]|uniref:MOSC domain-containing protein n=1 Tax=Acidihalobacter yilgarnensis TaxID=2819280 RepID=UPI0018D483D3|nr:MOSC domain-containing protein [Acidihalobacter yilgarnensis]
MAPFHLITTATLAHLKQQHPQSDWDVRRFRPNIVIDTLPDATGLLEQAWLGKRLNLGQATIDCSATTPRCGAVTRPQPGVVADPSILRTIVKAADQNLGIYGATVEGGDFQIGDCVYLV